MSSNNLWYVGVLLELVSTMSGTIGKQLIRLSEHRKRKNPALSRMTLTAGLVVNTVVGPVLDMGAYSFAAQSLIAPFGGLDVVWNAILAPYILKEKLTRRRALGCVLIVIGTSMAGGFGNHQDSEYTLEAVEETLVNLRVALYFCVFIVWFCFNRFYLMKWPAGSAIRGISLGCTAGTIAGNMFCVKVAIELIQRSIHEQEAEIWLHWLPWVALLGAAFFAVSNVAYMTRGLQEYEALFMVTIYEGSMIVSGCISGAIVLLDLRGLESWRVFLYATGVLIICLGMYVIFSQERMSTSSLCSGTASIDTSSLKAQGPARSGSGLTILEPEHKGRSAHSAIEPMDMAELPSPAAKMIRSLSGDSFSFNLPSPSGKSKVGSLQAAFSPPPRKGRPGASDEETPAEAPGDEPEASSTGVAKNEMELEDVRVMLAQAGTDVIEL